MTQYARPSADTFIGNFTDQVGGVTNIYTTIDEVSPDDTNYIESPYTPVNQVYVTKLSTIINPATTSNQKINVRYSKDFPLGLSIDLTVELRQGYVSEANLGTLIHSEPITNINTGFTTSTITLTAGEVGNILDYSSLFLRFIISHE